MAVAFASAFALAVEPAAAQTPYIPYFGKNQIRYDKFDWYTYETDHFVIYYYPEIEPHLERMAGYAESAYQHVSSELKYDLAHKVPLILFQTSSEFQQQNVIPGAAQEGVGAFAEPTRTAHRHADGRAAGPALPADRPRADAPVRVRHHPRLARPPRLAAVDSRGPGRLHDRRLAAAST